MNQNRLRESGWAYGGLIAGLLVGAAFGYLTHEYKNFEDEPDWHVPATVWAILGGATGFLIGMIFTYALGKSITLTQWRLLIGALSGTFSMILRDAIRYGEFRGILTVIPGIMMGGIVGVVWDLWGRKGNGLRDES